MPKKTVYISLLTIVIASLLFGGYLFWQNSMTKSIPKESAQLPAATPLEAPTVIAFGLAPQNDSGMSGTAILEEKNGTLNVSVTLVGGDGGTHPAHIHVGTCPEPGAVLHALSPVVDGVSETSLNANLESLRGKLPLAINVHKSQEESNIYISCGNVVFP